MDQNFSDHWDAVPLVIIFSKSFGGLEIFCVQIFKYIYITTLVLSYLTYNQIDNMQSKLHSNYIITTYNYIITTCELH